MRVAKLIPLFDEVLDFLFAHKENKRLKAERDDYKKKWERALKVNAKLMNGQQIMKSRGGKKNETKR